MNGFIEIYLIGFVTLVAAQTPPEFPCCMPNKNEGSLGEFGTRGNVGTEYPQMFGTFFDFAYDRPNRRVYFKASGYGVPADDMDFAVANYTGNRGTITMMLNNGTCIKEYRNERMRRPCELSQSTRLSDFKFGVDTKSTKAAFLQQNEDPDYPLHNIYHVWDYDCSLLFSTILHDSSGFGDDYYSTYTETYMNMKQGIVNESVFILPPECDLVPEPSEYTTYSDKFFGALKHMFIYPGGEDDYDEDGLEN